MQVADSEKQAKKPVTSAAPKTRTPKTRTRAPSWRQVMATTFSLWASRRLPRVRHPRALLVIIGVLVVAAAAAGAVRLTVTGTSSRSAVRASAPARPHQARAGSAVSGAAVSGAAVSGAASVRSEVAGWIVSQVSSSAAIGCDPAMCTALRADGVAASRLLSLAPAASHAPGADVIATSPAGRAGLSHDAPVLLASVGTGSSQVEVRATTAVGSASYASALAADLAARKSAGAQLLHSGRIQASAAGTAQLQAGQVDARMLIMLALLASQRSWQVVSFGDASPGVPLADAPYRQVIVAAAGSGSGSAGLAAGIALLHAQRAPYQPAQVTTVQLPGGQTGLRIDFATPGALGLLAGSISR
jgi:hypothetical protein